MARHILVSLVSLVFELHYKYTPMLLVLCSLIVWSSLPVWPECQPLPDASESGFCKYENNCWNTSTWATDDGQLPEQSSNNSKLDPSILHEVPRTYHLSCVLLCLQAFFFILPYMLWNFYEHGYLRRLCKEMRAGASVNVFEDTRHLLRNASNVYLNDLNKRRHYYHRYLHCHFMNLINIFLHTIFISYIYNFNFTMYGVNWFSETATVAFPEFTFCKMPPFRDYPECFGYCVLNVNIANSRVYFFIWLWFLFLAVVTSMDLMWEWCTKSGTLAVRKRWFQSVFHLESHEVERIHKYFDAGDYFLLMRVSESTSANFYSFTRPLVQTMEHDLTPPFHLKYVE